MDGYSEWAMLLKLFKNQHRASNGGDPASIFQTRYSESRTINTETCSGSLEENLPECDVDRVQVRISPVTAPDRGIIRNPVAPIKQRIPQELAVVGQLGESCIKH